MHPYTAKEAATSVAEAAGPYLAVAFVLCLVGVLAGAGSLKPTHLSEDPANRYVGIYIYIYVRVARPIDRSTDGCATKAARESDVPNQINSHGRSKDIHESRPDFATFNHRGPFLRSRQM